MSFFIEDNIKEESEVVLNNFLKTIGQYNEETKNRVITESHALLERNFDESINTLKTQRKELEENLKETLENPTELQIQLWINRHNIYYRILLHVIEENPVKNGVSIQPFTSNIPDIADYKISSFGSNNPTSDIDACIQYNGEGDNRVSGVIKAIEDIYDVYFEGSLNLDIEFYDSYISEIRDAKETYKYSFIEKDFGQKEFFKLFPYAIASMARNIYMGLEEKKHSGAKNRGHFIDILKRFCKGKGDFTLHDTESLSSVGKDKFDIIIRASLVIIKIVFSLVRFESASSSSQPTSQIKFETILGEIKDQIHVNDRSIIESIKKMVAPYFNITGTPVKVYNTRRETYYEKLEKVETLIKQGGGDDGDKHINEIIAICEAQLWRQEGYVCIPTVMHIPRLMQKCSDPKRDGCIDIPSIDYLNKSSSKGRRASLIQSFIASDACHEYKSSSEMNRFPLCLLGTYGYLLSLIEQVGYMVRFFLSHDRFDETDTKFKKYQTRLLDAVNMIRLSINMQIQPQRNLIKPVTHKIG
jgi:hypothetical protein